MTIVELEPEIQDGQRAFYTTQKLFTGAPTSIYLPAPITCEWYGTEVDPRRGAFVVVQEGLGLDVLVGEFLRITHRVSRKYIHVYCLAETPAIDSTIALSRRAFGEIDFLWRSQILVSPEVIR